MPMLLLLLLYNQNLIDHGANVNMVDEDGNAPLHLVCTSKAKPAQVPIAINVLVMIIL